jgi:outer membrane protein OmpA-like peptidoglycan-associated protein
LDGYSLNKIFMKQKFATIATDSAMPISTRKKNINYLVLFLCMSLSFSSIAQQNMGITIFGKATNKEGIALNNVQVKFDGIEMATTKEDGSYSFTTEKEVGRFCKLLFTKDGYNKAVRTYNAEMTNLDFSIKMMVPCKCDSVTKCNMQIVQFDFDNESNKLNELQKKQLNALIDCLKENPEKEIIVHYNTLYPKKQIGNKRLAAVLDYFMQKGITSDRVKSETVTNISVNTKQIVIENK